MKRLTLSLLFIIGTSYAETTENQLNSDIEDGFLNSSYDYPNIHTHKQIGINDNTIWTGSSKFNNEASQTVNTEIIDTLDQLDAINYGVDYYSNYNGTVTLKADFYDEAGIFLDNDGGTYTITTGSWQSLTNTYNEADYINDIVTITITIGGLSDTNGTDAIQLRDAFVSYDYSAIPLEEILEDTTLDDLIMDLIAEGAEVEIIEDVLEYAEVIADTVEEDTEDEPTDSEEAVETEESNDEQSDESESSESDTSSSSDGGNSNNVGSVSVSDTNDSALEVLDLVQSVNDNAMIGLTSTLDFSSYTSVSMVDAVELEDNEDWYQNQAFYKSVGMTDSGILKGYDKLKLKQGKWYGSDNQFY
jgi:hypothetical protein